MAETRRRVVAGLAALPLLAGGVRAATPRIGYLAVVEVDHLVAALLAGMEDLGYRAGRDFTLDLRFAGGDYEKLPALARELAATAPDIIVTTGNVATRAARDASTTIPIVMAPTGGNLVALGLVETLARPGGNVTGVSILSIELATKRLEILKEAMPGIRTVAALVNEGNLSLPGFIEDQARAAAALGVAVRLVRTGRGAPLPPVFERIAAERPDALTVMTDPQFDAARREIVALAAAHRLPAVYEHRAFVEAGGLVSYGADIDRVTRRAAAYVDRILRGAAPGGLPVEQATATELVINSRVAGALGLALPAGLLARADELID